MSHNRARLVRVSVCAVLANAAVGVGSVWAQSPDRAVLEEVTVTAQKREQALQDVGISVAAFSGDQMDRLGMDNTTAIASQVPALRISTFSPGLTIFSLRGVSQNNFQDNLEAPVAVYMDGAYVATMNAINAQMFDMERVEVLRGPQGTLFGRNATGGLVHFITRRADEDDLNGYAEVSFSEFATRSAEAALGGGFSDAVRGRLAARFEESDGYIEPGTAFGVRATGGRAAGADGYAVRGSIQADLSERVLLDVTGAYSRDDDVPTGQYVVTLAGFDPNTGLGAFNNAVDPADPDAGPVANFTRTPITGSGWRHWSNEFTGFDREVKSLNVQLTADLSDDVQLVSITNGMQMDKSYLEDAGGGFGYFPYRTENDYEQWSQEIRLSGGTEPLRWQIGGYYLDMTADTTQSVAGALILGGTSDAQIMTTFGKVRSKNWSAFGQVEYDIAPQWTVIGGLRWSQDDKSLDMSRFYEDSLNAIPRQLVFDIRDSGVPGIDDIDYGDYAARAQLNWKAQEDVLVFLAYNRGIKGGNWSLDPLGGVAIENLKHDSEKLNSYELGIKADLLDSQLRVNATAFYYDYKDYQAFSLLGVTPQVSNSDAEAKGGEIEITATPFVGLTLSLGAAFIDSEVDAVPDVFGGTVRAELPLAPATSVNVLAQYEWPMFGGLMALQLDGRWTDDQFLEGTNSEVSAEPAYSVWNGSLQYRTANDRVRASVWVKNFTDEEYRLYNLDLGLLGFIEQVYGPPRQAGITLSYHFN
ncbi:MAG TPA: TonB-dependent receptor [Steroidobacter sp.]|uniref:TonB-dependent receptor n=1 Tax=Steroidobacter sp. TaxID=1978227 RepID=UPI002ED8A74C